MFVRTFSSSFLVLLSSSWFPTVTRRMVWSADNDFLLLSMHFFRIQIKPRRTTNAADEHLDPAATVPLPTSTAKPQRFRSSIWQILPFKRSVSPNKVNHRWLSIWNDPNERTTDFVVLPVFPTPAKTKKRSSDDRRRENVSICYMGFANRIDGIVIRRKVRHRSGLCVCIEEWSIG